MPQWRLFTSLFWYCMRNAENGIQGRVWSLMDHCCGAPNRAATSKNHSQVVKQRQVVICDFAMNNGANAQNHHDVSLNNLQNLAEQRSWTRFDFALLSQSRDLPSPPPPHSLTPHHQSLSPILFRILDNLAVLTSTPLNVLHAFLRHHRCVSTPLNLPLFPSKPPPSVPTGGRLERHPEIGFTFFERKTLSMIHHGL
ncbi:hypothetical protein BDV96DRAFT_603279 [Lophiotrema nucula]|uniref:Uncharacterized protein n=1 Tax=Lophiotrema nucula TaxID=690887 RepID=A0A6A5YVK1_9PLEO|nr:hypothetical protein BDV96DRAFT_603279 [Lophiotrema nucula]